MRLTVAMAVALVTFACSVGGAKPMNHQPPTLSRPDAEQLMLRADDVKRLALYAPRTARLPDAFGGRALQMLEAQVQSMDRRGLRIEERNSERKLVFWDPRAGEAVLQVVADRRLVTLDQPNPSWAATVRQWWARLQYAEGSWWVVDQEDLTPDQWRPVARAGGYASRLAAIKLRTSSISGSQRWIFCS